MAVQDIRDALVIRERDLFLLTDTAGQVPLGNSDGYGLYYADTRYLSAYEFSFAGTTPLVLLSTAELGYSSEQVLTNPSMVDTEGQSVPRGTIEVRRVRVLEDVMEETVRTTNYNAYPVELDLTLRIAADFADIFEVRGYQRELRGAFYQPVWRQSELALAYKGRDGRKRETLLSFEPGPRSVQRHFEMSVVNFRVSLGPRTSETIRVLVSMDGRLEIAREAERFSVVKREYEAWFLDATRIETDNAFFNAVLERSLTDLRMLWNHGSAGTGYPAAGTPWFDTLFGRDSAVVGLQTLALKPAIARDCLVSLARWQGKKFDSWRDEEPGKILHELRQGELTSTGELPFSPYFGSVDSTPLFLWLAGEYFAWTGDTGLLSQLETNLRAAVHWLTQYGDSNGDGYLDYEKRSSRGLVNQGWKDSGDSICHADGSPVEPPVTLVEVQGYVYAALGRLAQLFLALGDGVFAQELAQRAKAMERRFNQEFWLDEGCFALALDGTGRQAASITSNAGHALWSAIARRPRGKQVVERLMAGDMFSGWGVRTLSAESPRFNPLGYHLGTVWPHDNSIIAMGFKRYGFEDELNELATALFDAARAFPYYRLPELFAGTERSAHQAPVPYPVACRPQAWAAGAFPLIIQAILGLCPDAPNGRLLVVQPKLPAWLKQVRVEGMRIGSGEVDLTYELHGKRTRVEVTRKSRGISVEQRRTWPRMSAIAREYTGSS